MEKELKIALLRSNEVEYYIVDCVTRILKFCKVGSANEFMANQDILLYTDSELLAEKFPRDEFRHIEHYNTFLNNLGALIAESTFRNFRASIQESYETDCPDLFNKMWEHYGTKQVATVSPVPILTVPTEDKIIKLAIQRDNSVAYYHVNCTKCCLQYVRSDELDQNFVTKEGFDLFVYDKTRDVDLSLVDFDSFKRVELYGDFLKSIEINVENPNPEEFYTTLKNHYDEVGAKMYDKMFKIYSAPERIYALDEMHTIFANSPIATAVKKMSLVALPPKTGELVYLGYRDAKGVFHLSKKVEDNDKAAPSDYLNYYTDGNVLMMNNPWSAKSFYMLNDMLEIPEYNGTLSSDPMYKHKEAMEFISDSFMTRAKQISTYKNEERDIRFLAEGYPVNSTFYNSLVEQTNNTLHISPNQLEEMYVLQDITQQLDIELSDAKNKINLQAVQITSSDNRDYHKSTANLMFEPQGAPEDCVKQVVYKKPEATIMSEKYRRDLFSSLLTPYKAIIQKAEKEMEEALSVTNSIRGAVILERDAELLRGLITSEIETKLQKDSVLLAKQDLSYNERDLVTVGFVHSSGKAFSYHCTNDKENTLYKTDGNTLVAYSDDIPHTILLSEFKYTDNEFAIAENAEEGWKFNIPLTFLQIAKSIATYKNVVRDNLYNIGASKLNATFYNSLCEMTYGNVSESTAVEIENALLVLMQANIITLDERNHAASDEIDLAGEIQYYSDARFSVDSNWETKVTDNMLLVDSLGIYNKYYALINSAYHLQLLMAKVQESAMNVKPSNDSEIEKIVNTIMKAIEVAPTEYRLKRDN